MNYQSDDTNCKKSIILEDSSFHCADLLPKHVLNISHETIYRYNCPVNFSKHWLRLHLVRDQYQKVLNHQITVSAEGHFEHFEDVFNNHVTFYQVEAPYSELTISMNATVELAVPRLNHESKVHRQHIPLIWLPWQRQMMLGYLLPPELPEFQLSTLTDYAMSFVERNNYHIIAILNDINQTIYNEYMYVSGLTDLSTTPFEVFQHRKGVCQDFANLFLCLARLLSIPARYRSGYIFTSSEHENTVQSEASHAWVEVYLPWLGWIGFDPTNGYLASSDHVRLACGRNYFDAAPISGTIFANGGNGEQLEINVKVSEVTS